MSTVPLNRNSNETHRACRWYGKKDMRVEDVAKPQITEPTDALIKITATAICGSDLHMYTNFMPGMQKGDQVGHEFMGIVEEVSSQVKGFKKGERVVVAFDIGCGSCFFCKKKLFSSCTTTNPTKEMEQLYGDRTAGMFGYSHLTGGHAGGQAEYARVPFAETNLLKIPEALKGVSDEKLLFFSDILPTAWHSVELGNVSNGDVVAIWGSGPVGILAARLAQIRGAKRVIVIDQEAYRLKFVQEKVPGVEVINFAQDKDVVGKLKELTTYGPDVGIEAVGFHYCKSLVHQLQTKVGLETDSGDILNEIIQAVRKGGRISVIGAYAGTVNMFNIGAFMEKGLSMAAGQTPCQKYWPTLLDIVQKGEIDPSMVISHVMSLEDAPKGYSIFNEKQDNCIKVVLKPGIKA